MMKQINGQWFKKTYPIYIDPYELNGTLDEAIALLRKEAENLTEPQISFTGSWDAAGNFILTGYVPATQAEITRHYNKLTKDRERAEKKRKQEREKKRLARERADAEALERVKKKYPEMLK